MNYVKNVFLTVLLVLTSISCFRFIPMEYHIPVTDVNNEAYYVWLSWFVDHIADDNDTLNFEIASHGGSVFHGYRLVSAILKSDSHTVAKVKSGALSMGAVIMIVCDEIEASKYSEVMIHKARAGWTVLNMPMVDELIKEHAYKYMTKYEILQYTNKKDVWINGPDFASRVKIVKYWTKKGYKGKNFDECLDYAKNKRRK